MHILFLTDNFWPEVNAPASRTHEHCKRWIEMGHRVTVITCAPNFPKGKVFDGYRNRLWQSETFDGIRVIRVWSYITANEGFLRRILDYMSFMLTGGVAGLCVGEVDVVVGTSPQFFTACAAWFVGAIKRRPFVFELRDLWPESIKAVGAMQDSTVIRLLERVELFLYRRAAHIVSVTHSFKRNLVARRIDVSKISVVTNGVDLSRYSPRPKDAELTRSLGLEDQFVIGYVGTHGMAHGLNTLVEAARILAAEHPDFPFRLILLGDGAEKAALVRAASELGLRNVIFVDSVGKDEVPRYWSVLDASVIHLRKTDLFSTVIPSKLFESAGMGIPVLFGVKGESEEIVQRDGMGLTFEPENARALVEATLKLAGDGELRDKLKANCSVAAHRYNRDTLARDMLAILTDVAEKPNSSTPVRNGPDMDRLVK